MPLRRILPPILPLPDDSWLTISDKDTPKYLQHFEGANMFLDGIQDFTTHDPEISHIHQRIITSQIDFYRSNMEHSTILVVSGQSFDAEITRIAPQLALSSPCVIFI
jgi:hypothetical protein